MYGHPGMKSVRIEFVNGRYQVNLPFKENRRVMEDKFALAERRLGNLKKKLKKDPVLCRKYDEIMKTQLHDGIVERVVIDPIVGEVTYLPHRAVIRDDKAGLGSPPPTPTEEKL